MVLTQPTPDVETLAVTTCSDIGVAADDARIVDIHSDASPARTGRYQF
jgi:hypothetical protein